ncbi:MAG: DUF1570 domain-containing protein [Planctomycetota bacterium]|nr:MAG: DUF1570 domain-containing protein [Planctomycetota bacterium]REJ86683.1 MAG: DUF1570 domain-containing protein [Planctomycetota bacterium]
MYRAICVAALFFVTTVWATAATYAANYMIRVDVDGRSVEGRPVYWTKSRVQLMLRDGQLLDFRTNQARNFHRSAGHFRSYTASEIRSRLSAELGNQFDVTGTGHYLVAHPAGERDRWAERFEDLYRSFVHYFSVRGMRLEDPEFPLIAVVWKNQNDYRKYAARTGHPIGTDVLGYYSPMTNRVHLFDEADGRTRGAQWRRNAKTIIHEVTHQTAFNTGVHRRFVGCPRWVAEGLGTLFEAEGVYDSRNFSGRGDRVNRTQLAAYQRYAPQLTKAALADMITSDRGFQHNTSAAYAQAWAFSFYLSETQPRRYTEYLTKTANREPGGSYSPQQRLADFTSIFGDNFAMHQARFSRFMADVR